MKILNTLLKVLLSLILIMPIFGVIGVFPPPTADMYNTPEAFSFIQILMDSGYINYIMVIVFIVSLFCLWAKRVALASLIILPITINIVGFHAFLDGGLFKAGASMALVFFALNIYFLWQSRAKIIPLFKK